MRHKAFSVSTVAAAGFAPSDIAGLVGWWDASDTGSITHSSGEVTQWSDLSGGGFHVTNASGTDRPLTGTRTVNGLNAIDFDGTNDLLDYAGSPPWYASGGESTIFIVCEPDTVTTTHQVLVGEFRVGSANGEHRLSLLEDRLYFQHFGDSGSRNHDFSRAAPRVGSPGIVRCTVDDVGGSNYRVATTLDGKIGVATNPAGSVPFSPTTITGLVFGARIQSGTPGLWFNGALCEVIMYNSVLSQGDIDLVEEYLADKWGVTLVPSGWTPASIDNYSLFAWYDASDTSTLTVSGGVASAWADKSVNNRDLTAASGQRPGSGSLTQNGLNVLDFDSDKFVGASAADYKFLGDGTDFIFSAVVKFGNSADPNDIYCLYSTNNIQTTSQVGSNLYFDDRASVPRNEVLNFSLSNGSGSIPVELFSGNAFCTPNVWHRVTVRFQKTADVASGRRAWIWCDASVVGPSGTASVESASNPFSALVIGGRGSDATTFDLVGQVGEIVIAAAGDQFDVEEYLDAKWGL